MALHKLFKRLYLIFLIFLTTLFSFIHADGATDVTFNQNSLKIELGETASIHLHVSPQLPRPAQIYFTYQTGSEVEINQTVAIVKHIPPLNIPANVSSTSINVTGVHVGSITVGINSTDSIFATLFDCFLRVSVVHSKPLEIIIAVIGWTYFVAWSVSFYPQVYINWSRKSVIGLNFDFLLYNITGFLAYGVFNVGLFWIPEIKAEYKAQHPRGVIPVLANDVFFALHAVFVTSITIGQTFIYDRGNQKVSKVGIVVIAVCWLFALVSLFVAVGGAITWLNYLYFFSYIKLFITLIKYIPQAYMNYKRKSTEGWSIGNVVLDFTGGSFSMLQMFLLAYNYDDWGSLFGDPTKFGLGLFSVLFDILFMIQHYILYRNKSPGVNVQENEEKSELLKPENE